MKTENPEWARFFPSPVALALLLMLLTFFSHGHCGASKPLSVSEILERVQHRYGATDFEADFVQESHLKAMGMVDTAKGHVYFKPPAGMRWHYKTPEQYFIITDGNSVWIHRPAENQVMAGRAADYFGNAEWTKFFNEPGKLLDGFVVQLAGTGLEEKDRYVLKLLPKTRQPDLVDILLFISKNTFDIVQSVTHNAFGDKTTIRFDSFRFNQGLDESLFMFKIPKGADVMQLE